MIQSPEKARLMELIVNFANIYWQKGIFVGVQSSADFVIQEAGEEFKKGEDVKAKMLRQIGHMIRENARVMEAKESTKRSEEEEKIYAEIIKIVEGVVPKKMEVTDGTDNLIAEVRRRRNQ